MAEIEKKPIKITETVLRDAHQSLMGPNVAGVIGTAVAAGTFMAIFGVK